MGGEVENVIGVVAAAGLAAGLGAVAVAVAVVGHFHR